MLFELDKCYRFFTTFKDQMYLDLDLDLERFVLRDRDLLRGLRDRERPPPLDSSINLIRLPFNSVPSSLSIAFFKSCNRK